MDLENLLKTTLKRTYPNQNGAHSEDSLFPARVCIEESSRDIYGSGISDMNQHEFRYIDKSHLHLWRAYEIFTVSDILSCDCKHKVSKRTVLTSGVSGIGKTTAVQRFALEWAEGRGHHHIRLLFPLTFWELNLLKGPLSLIELIHTFYPQLENLSISDLKGPNVWFVLDGLDECRLPLNFKCQPVSSVSEQATLDCLLTSLIRGKLLPSAHLWITTRPAAAELIPVGHLLKATELQGFSEEQKEQHFRRLIPNEELAIKVINHVKTSRSLESLCQIPQICSIMACVLKNHVPQADGEFKINPINLTQIYTKLINTQVTNPDKIMIAKLEKLALRQLGRDNLMYEHDLEVDDISLREAAEYSKHYPLVLREERGLHDTAVYRFGHSSIQEYFAASSAVNSIEPNDQTALFLSCQVLLSEVLHSGGGNTDVFLRFIFGLMRERGRMEPTNTLVDYIKNRILEYILSDSAVSLLHCLREFDRHAFLSDVEFLRETHVPPYSAFSPTHWAFLAQRIQYFEGVQDIFEMPLSNRCDESIPRKLSAIVKSRKAMLRFSNLTENCCSALAAAVSTRDSYLRELDLGYNSIRDDGVKELMRGLTDQDCKLKTLRLQGCGVTAQACVYLATVLSQSPKLRQLDLSGNEIGDDGLLNLARGVSSPGCRLHTLKLSQCGIKERGCCSLASALESNPDHLKVLDLSINAVRDKGAKELFKRVDIAQFTKLDMCHCSLTALSCEDICKALQSETSTLVELNLSHNSLMDSGFKQICIGMYAWCRLEKLNVSRCGITARSCVYLAKALWLVSQLYSEGFVQKTNLQAIELRDLDLSMNCISDEAAAQVADGLRNPYGHLTILNLSNCGLTERCCQGLASGFASEESVIAEVDLSDNDLKDKGMKRLCVGLQNPHCKMKKLALRSCSLSSVSVQYLTNALKLNPRHLEEVHLMGNRLDSSGIGELMQLVRNQKYMLHTTDVTVE
ncbi:NACHT, LRR and PYD domains-containing protein 14-like [Myripristis murdjan]|uniref:NACHT, LRR and PYD domains-containing protein 14-like n=1 Tax=Myripristis murdjan TaxID=586833 RepID=A0A667WZZ0_9TELE|nr:NACHT, LRR and PYD domains-containing protein 14-like [Myripristis murdjan]